MKKGFTLLEIVVVVGIMLILLTIAFSSIRMANDSMRAKTHQEIYSTILSTARRARDGANNSDWGVYFVYDPVTKQGSQLIIFSGENYATRDTSADIISQIDDSILFKQVNLVDIAPYVGNGNEIIFESFTGLPHQIGGITLSSIAGQTSITIDHTGIPMMSYE